MDGRSTAGRPGSTIQVRHPQDLVRGVRLNRIRALGYRPSGVERFRVWGLGGRV